SPELLAVSDYRHIWGTTFEFAVSDLPVKQSDIARQISENLRMRLTGTDRDLLSKTHTSSADAYQAYLKGRYYWNKRSEEGYRNAINSFQQAISSDPKYALAFAGLADCYMLLSDYGFIPPSEGYPEARSEVKKALAIDDSLAEAHTSLAAINQGYYWNWVEAEKEFARAIQLNPNYSTARHWYALYLAASGRLDEAISEITRARELDPFSLGINKDYG